MFKELGIERKDFSNFQNLEEEDIKALCSFKKNNPHWYDRFIKCKDIIKNREISIIDILKENMNDDKRANLIEQFECLRQIPECTEEYLHLRDRIKKMYIKYIMEGESDEKSKTKQDDDYEVFKNKLTSLLCSDNNRKILEEKLEEYEESEKGDEKLKLKKWLNSVLCLPFDNIKENREDVSIKIKDTLDGFDKKLYGMDRVKERLILFLNKKLREKNSKGCNIALVGKPGVGKCLHGDTEIIMYSLKIKKARDIVVGDVLLGDDSQPRVVLSVTSGRENMYRVLQECGNDYIVNKSHILTLKNNTTKEVQDICLKDLVDDYEMKEKEKSVKMNILKFDNYHPVSSSYEGTISLSYNAFIHGANLVNPDIKTDIPDNCIRWNMITKNYFYKGLTNNKNLITYDNKYMIIKIHESKPIELMLHLLRSMGYRCKYNFATRCLNILIAKCNENLFVKLIGEGDYYGFTLDGNERFVLSDWTVTHNTAIAKSLSDSLNLPFAQISFGGITSPEFLMGHDYTYIGSRLGEISRCLSRMGSKNGILFFDEFDKASDKKEIMSSLLHITDFSQNNEFRDNYCPEITQDLSKIWFIYSMNELPSDPAMLDRLEVIKVEEYNRFERELICKNYLFPKYLKELKIEDKVLIEESGVNRVVLLSSCDMDRKGVRELERYIGIVVEKIYFFLCNIDNNFNYDWFTKLSFYYKDSKILLCDDLIEKLVENSKIKDNSFMSMYM